jgi:predicted amidohydrolase YtcJ
VDNSFCLVNGKIYLSFKPTKTANSLVVINGRVAYAGDEGRARGIADSLDLRVIDLKERVALPGFIDSHVHLDELGMYLEMLNLKDVESIEELKRWLKLYIERGKWVLGHGWDQERLKEKRFPTRWDLDDVIKDKPVMLTRICLHAAVLNTKAMEITGLLENENPDVIKNDKGDPIGVIVEKAFEKAREKVKEDLTQEDYMRFLCNAMDFAASQGVTTVGFVSCDRNSLMALHRLKSEKKLKIRVRVYLNPDTLKLLEDLGIRGGFGDEFLRVNGLKILADGSLGARTAWLSEPYSDSPTSGGPNISRDELMKIVEEADKNGLQLAIHGIGDRTIDMILDVYEKVGTFGKRHRIEHASVVRDDQIARISNLGVVVSVQPHFIVSDWWVVKRVGKRRAKWVYRFKNMLLSGINLSFGTDCPVENLNPWETLHAAVTRGGESLPLYDITKGECLDLEDALYCYTKGSAYALFDEENLGSLEKGKLADFIVVNRDPFEADDLRKLKVLETYVGGIRVFNGTGHV